MKKNLLVLMLCCSFTFLTAQPSDKLGDGNKQLLQQTYLHHQYRSRDVSNSLPVIRKVMIWHEARKVCRGWRIQPQREFDTCVAGLRSVIKK